MIVTKNLLLSLATILLLNCISCKKSGGGSFANSSTSEYYFECKINGELKTFNYNLTSLRYLNSENKEIDFGGRIEPLGTMVVPSFNIQIGSFQSGVVIIPKTYTEPANGIAGNGVLASYANGNTFLYSSIYSNPRNFTVTITELNNTFVKGTFSGIMKDNFSGATINITEGKFYVKHCTFNC
jgi:hypothetical protein